ncbi:phosphoglycerate dehydrogenase [Thalassobaculum sp.]|uniref:phosphoglycerate dehydrogenase n=1 Tax=Thalassobaculum sp. TaxID=2022740 RepID=UPI0032EF3969
MIKVLISDNLSDQAAEIFRARGIEVDVNTGLKPDELKAIIGDYDGLAIRSATKVTPDVLAVAGKLKVVGRAGIGVDNVDIAAATAGGVVVMNTPFGNAITTAEHAVAMMFALARQIPQADASTQAGKWEKSKFMGVELTGKVLGLIGCGNIGSIVADRARGLRMRVLAFDPYLSEQRATELGVRKVELDELFGEAEIITLHTPLTDATRNIIDAAAIAKMKKGVRIINCARGGLVVEEDLRAGLDSGQVGGAAFDVFVTEPARENVLFGHPNVVCTPHLGASTSEAQEKVALQVAEQMSDYLLTGAVSNAVNVPSVTAEEAPILKPYMKLAELLGSFCGQMVDGPIDAVTLEFEGHAADLNAEPIKAAALAGLLRPQVDSVNMVNAPTMAHQRGIEVSVTRHDREPDYQTLVRMSVRSEQRTRVLVGTLIGGTKPRLVEVQGIAVEADFGRHMLYVRNYDKPGFIGALGSALGNHGVNIATFHLGRRDVGGEAIALVEVDQAIDAALLAEVQGLPHVVRVNALSF